MIRLERNAGYAAAVNVGVACSRGADLVLLNNDTVLARVGCRACWPIWARASVRSDRAPTAPRGRPASTGPGRPSPTTWTSPPASGASGAAPVDVDRLTYSVCGDAAVGVGPGRSARRGLRHRDVRGRRPPGADPCGWPAGPAGARRRGRAPGRGDAGHPGAERHLRRGLRANRRRFEQRHGAWTPHEAPADPGYSAAVRRLQRLVLDHVPVGETVVVVSRATRSSSRSTAGVRCTSRANRGRVGRHHPADAAEAIDELAWCENRGSRFFLLPAPQSWWLDQYDGLREHLGEHYRTVVADDAGMLYERADDDRRGRPRSGGGVGRGALVGRSRRGSGPRHIRDRRLRARRHRWPDRLRGDGRRPAGADGTTTPRRTEALVVSRGDERWSASPDCGAGTSRPIPQDAGPVTTRRSARSRAARRAAGRRNGAGDSGDRGLVVRDLPGARGGVGPGRAVAAGRRGRLDLAAPRSGTSAGPAAGPRGSGGLRGLGGTPA